MKQVDEYIYYIRDHDNRPMVTVCLIRNKDGMYARGIAICSLSETGPDKSVGRMYAHGRAMRAFKKATKCFNKATVAQQTQWSPVNRVEAYKSLMMANQPILPMENFYVKSVYNPKFNSIEEQLIKKRSSILMTKTD